jgi:diguanylate cyclase (GGDEF)-like protein/PAS domain S-box-containing protein
MPQYANSGQGNELPYEILLDQIYDGLYLVSRNGQIIFWNKGAERITGYSRDEMIGRTFDHDFLTHQDAAGAPLWNERSVLDLCLRENSAVEAEAYIGCRGGRRVPVLFRITPVHDGRGEVIGALEVFTDNTTKVTALKRIEELEEAALLCPLTGVGNRRYTEMALQNTLEELKRYQWPVGVMFVDVDNFKRVNDTYGHNVGDEVLRMVAHALRNCLRSFDFVGRWGGEEFVILLPNVNEDVLRRIGERCRLAVEDSEYHTEGHTVRVTVSIGGTMARTEDTPTHVIERADRLMYRAKAAGRNRLIVEE